MRKRNTKKSAKLRHYDAHINGRLITDAPDTPRPGHHVLMLSGPARHIRFLEVFLPAWNLIKPSQIWTDTCDS